MGIKSAKQCIQTHTHTHTHAHAHSKMIMLYLFTIRLHGHKRTSHLKTSCIPHVQETKNTTSFGLKVAVDFISTLETEPCEWRQQDRVDKKPPCVTAPLPHTTAILMFVLQRCQHSSCMLGQSAAEKRRCSIKINGAFENKFRFGVLFCQSLHDPLNTRHQLFGNRCH